MATTTSSVDISLLFEGIRNGDRLARNQLFNRFYERIQRLTAVMLRSFPVVKQRREVESVSNDLVAKLMHALEDPKLTVGSEADFFRLAAHKLRFLLIDEANKYRRRNEILAARALKISPDGSHSGYLGGQQELNEDPIDTDSCSPEDLEEWTRFHEQISALPAEEKTVVEMHFFMNMTQAEVAKVLNWEPKQVSRKWLAASMKLADYLPAIK